jgi:hypothetical protein
MGDLNATTIAALAGACVLVIGAIAGGIVTIITAIHQVGAKADVIVGHVNSEKTASQGREATLQAENALLREMLADSKGRAALLAQAAAARQADVRTRVADIEAGRDPIHDASTPVPVEVVNFPPKS